MAVGKRLRYEILRRDGNKCRYCGGAAPDVALRVDHVVPVALGGSDDPSNLVAACHDCNIGKSASTADSALVADVNENAMLWRQLTEAAGAQLRADRDGELRFCGEAYEAWEGVSYGRWSIPRDASVSFSKMYAAGVTIDDIRYAANAMADAFGVTYHWAYFCGIVWKMVRKRDELAQQMWNEIHNGKDA